MKSMKCETREEIEDNKLAFVFFVVFFISLTLKHDFSVCCSVNHYLHHVHGFLDPAWYSHALPISQSNTRIFRIPS